MKLTIIIPTRGRPQQLGDCLAHLSPSAQNFDRDNYEIIVTDDAQGDQTVEALLAQHFPEVIWTSGPSRGPAANRNHGASLATGDLLIFIDDDCLPQSGLLAAYHQAFADGSLLAAEGRILADSPPTRMDHVSPINETGGYFWSCNIALRRDFFFKSAQFDERFPSAAMEDVELRERIRSMGISIRFIPEALVLHPYRIMSGWKALKRSAEAEVIYAQFPHCHLPPPSYRKAIKDTLRIIYRQYIPLFFSCHGRGIIRRTLSLTYPLLSVWLIKRGHAKRK